MALINVARGYTRGYLALDGERIVGWCHTNDQAKLPRLTELIQAYLPEGRTAVMACFMVHPDYRQQGIASPLATSSHRRLQGRGVCGFDGSAFYAKPCARTPISRQARALFERGFYKNC